MSASDLIKIRDEVKALAIATRQDAAVAGNILRSVQVTSDGLSSGLERLDQLETRVVQRLAMFDDAEAADYVAIYEANK